MLFHRGEQILARFPGPVTARPELTPSVGLFIAVPMLIVAVCLRGIWQGLSKGLGLVAAISAFGGVAIAVNLRTNSMTLDREGFEVVIGVRKKKQRFLWKDVCVFESKGTDTGRIPSHVAFDDARKGGGILAVADRALGFRNTTLFEDFGMGAEQLAELLNHWRDRALASGGHEAAGC
jgi:hypothetical protein